MGTRCLLCFSLIRSAFEIYHIKRRRKRRKWKRRRKEMRRKRRKRRGGKGKERGEEINRFDLSLHKKEAGRVF